MKVLLLGGTDLSFAIARQIVAAGFDLAGIVHLGRLVGISYDKRGIANVRYANIGEWCDGLGIRNIAFSDNSAIEAFAKDIEADFLLVAGWYHIVPSRVRLLFPKGVAGLHASLLPRLRGGAPLSWAILSGADKTGISMFALSDEVDAGSLYGQVEIPIGPRTIISELVAAVEAASLTLVTDCLAAVEAGTMVMQAQTGAPTYCLQRTPEDGRIDWRANAEDIDRLVRAVSRPYPGAFSAFDGRKITFWRTEIASPTMVVYGVPGQIARVAEERDPIIVTGRGSLVIKEADIEGDDALPLLRKSGHMRLAIS